MKKNSLTYQALQSFFGKNCDELRRVGHVVVDVQRVFCDPNYSGYGSTMGNEETDRIAGRLADVVVPSLRIAVAKTFFVGMYGRYRTEEGTAPYRVSHVDRDVLVEKNETSAFKGGKIEETLIEHNVSKLIFSGVNAGHCVLSTLLDADSKGFEVCVLSDCVGTGDKIEEPWTPDALRIMNENNIPTFDSGDALSYIAQNGIPEVLLP